jgi:adenylate kinase family enzyme
VPSGNAVYPAAAAGAGGDLRKALTRIKELEAELELERTGLAGTGGSGKKPPFDVVALAVGPPGAGMTTQARLLARSRPDVVVLEIGALFLAEVARASPTGAAVEALLNAGAAVPDALVVAIIAAALRRAAAEDVEGKKVAACVFGFPRSLQQCLLLEERCAVPSVVVSLECAGATAAGRIASGPPRLAPRSQQQLAGAAAALSRYGAQGKVVHVDAEGSVDAVAEAMKVPLAEIDRVLSLKARGWEIMPIETFIFYLAPVLFPPPQKCFVAIPNRTPLLTRAIYAL